MFPCLSSVADVDEKEGGSEERPVKWKTTNSWDDGAGGRRRKHEKDPISCIAAIKSSVRLFLHFQSAPSHHHHPVEHLVTCQPKYRFPKDPIQRTAACNW